MSVEAPQEKLESLINCAICLEAIVEPMRCPACNNNLCVSCVDQLAVRLYTENRRYSCPLCRAKVEPIQNQGIMQHLSLLQAILSEQNEQIENCVDAYNQLQKVNFAKIESFLASVELLKPGHLNGSSEAPNSGVDVRASEMKAVLLHRHKLEEAKLKLEYFRERAKTVHQMLKLEKKGLANYCLRIVLGNPRLQYFIQWPFWLLYFLAGAVLLKYLSLIFAGR